MKSIPSAARAGSVAAKLSTSQDPQPGLTVFNYLRLRQNFIGSSLETFIAFVVLIGNLTAELWPPENYNPQENEI